MNNDDSTVLVLLMIGAFVFGSLIGISIGQADGYKSGYKVGIEEGKAIEKQHAELVKEMSDAGASAENINQLQFKLDKISARVDRGLINGCKSFTVENGGHYPSYFMTLGNSQFDMYNEGRNNTTAYSVCS